MMSVCSSVQAWTKRGDPVLHIELRRWADILVIAPLDANTLAKIANGLCDNLLVSMKLNVKAVKIIRTDRCREFKILILILIFS